MESSTLTIRLLNSEPLPLPGSELQVQWMAGRYSLTIEQVLTIEKNSDGTVSVEVQAARTLMEETGQRTEDIRTNVEDTPHTS